MKKILFFGFIFGFGSCLAQAPVINSIQPVSAGPTQKIVITGSGFSATSSNLQVWFDNVKGTITSSTAFSIEVQVPPQAHFSNVEVLNLTNNLSAKSPIKFFSSFGGSSFDQTKIKKVFYDSSYATDPAERFDIASSDLDLDGKPDLVVSKLSSGTTTDLLIYQNASTGIGNINFNKFDKTNLAVLNVGANTKAIACGDLNGDGKPDIVAGRTGSNSNQLFILKNTSTTGALSFASAASILLDAGQAAFRPVIRDLNGDGKPEIIVSNSFAESSTSITNQIYIFPNQSTLSTITFGTPIKLSTGSNTTYGIDVQDFDGDLLPDIVAGQFQSNNFYVFRNQSTGNITFAPVQPITATGSFNEMTSADLNNDGKLDLIATATFDDKVEIWLNSSSVGNISFNAPINLNTSVDPGLTPPTDGGPWAVDASDLDGDGDLDLVVTNRYYAKMNIFRQDGSVNNFTKLEITTTKFTRNLRVNDFDGDGKPDIAFTSFNSLLSKYSVDVIRNTNCWNPIITSPSTVICNGQTIRLSTKPALGASFIWKNGASTVQTSPLEYFDATAIGTYSVTANGTFDVGCSMTSSGLTLKSNPSAPPSDPSINNANTACIGSSLNLSTALITGASYAWTGPNNFTSAVQNPTVTPVTNAVAGTYTLQVTDTVSGCKSNIVSKDVDVASVPVLPVTASPSAIGCAGSTITLNVTGTGYSYQWNKGGNPIGGQTSSSLSLTSLAAASEGDYSVAVTNTTTHCSQETAKTSVKVFSAPVTDFSFSSPQCVGVPVNFTNASTGDSRGTLTYSWAFGDGNTSTSQNASNIYASANSFGPTLITKYAEISSGCTTPKLKSLTINAPVVPSIQASANPICHGDVSSLSVTGSFSLITWSGNGLSGSTSSVDINKPSKYFVNTTDNNGCLSKDSITIDAKPLIPLIVSKDRSIKLGDTVHLIASGADAYLWMPGKTLNDSTVATPVAKPSGTITYILLATKSGYCDSTRTIKITVETGSAFISPPVLFSPDGNAINDTWQIPDAVSYPDWTMTVYDGHGSQVYQQKGYNSANAWDGTFNGKNVPDGTYFYVFSNSKDKPATGSVLVVRQ